MIPTLIYKRQFQKSYALLKPKIKDKVKETLDTFLDNPIDPRLWNHKLTGKISHLRSLDVTGDYRIWIHQIDQQTYEIVEVIDVGTHSQLYW